MNPKKKVGSVETEQESAPSKKAPVKVFLLDDVSASIFAHEHPVRGELRTFYSVSFSRSYRDAGGSRIYVKTFNLDDLGKVISVAQQADEYIRSLAHVGAESIA